eukprot:TRINITY_DN4218_c0_g1_i1.p1 TRINITY_DN4218_c0_g1~~TRINITY_DN4218_c0_g1_i1.p1  ORF type:complete len:403 (+),score=109.42 TRINITY_DN4218_c0_g1_i1:88-1296(+)
MDFLYDGSRAEANCDFDRALNLYNELLATSQNPDAYLRRAVVHGHLELFDDMNAGLEKFLRLAPDWHKTNPEFSGWLRKAPEKRVGKAKDRYFYIKDKFCFYSVSPHTEPIGWFFLHDCTVEEGSKDNFSVLVTTGRTYKLSGIDKEEWVESFKHASTSKFVPQLNAGSRISASLEAQEIREKDGYLHKRGKANTSWKQRWFVLKNSLLFYFTNQEEDTPLGTIELKGSKCLPVAVDDKSVAENKYKFVIETKKRTYYLYASEREEQIAWITRIRASSEMRRRSTIVKPVSMRREENMNSNMSSTPPMQIPGSPAKNTKRNSKPAAGFVRASANYKDPLEVTELVAPSTPSDGYYDQKSNRKSRPVPSSRGRNTLEEPLLDDWDDLSDTPEESGLCSNCTIL